MKKTIEIKIEADFGSEYQKESGFKSLKVLLEGWILFYRANHKKNNVEYTIKES